MTNVKRRVDQSTLEDLFYQQADQVPIGEQDAGALVGGERCDHLAPDDMGLNPIGTVEEQLQGERWPFPDRDVGVHRFEDCGGDQRQTRPLKRVEQIFEERFEHNLTVRHAVEIVGVGPVAHEGERLTPGQVVAAGFIACHRFIQVNVHSAHGVDDVDEAFEAYAHGVVHVDLEVLFDGLEGGGWTGARLVRLGVEMGGVDPVLTDAGDLDPQVTRHGDHRDPVLERLKAGQDDRIAAGGAAAGLDVIQTENQNVCLPKTEDRKNARQQDQTPASRAKIPQPELRQQDLRCGLPLRMTFTGR